MALTPCTDEGQSEMTLKRLNQLQPTFFPDDWEPNQSKRVSRTIRQQLFHLRTFCTMLLLSKRRTNSLVCFPLQSSCCAPWEEELWDDLKSWDPLRNLNFPFKAFLEMILVVTIAFLLSWECVSTIPEAVNFLKKHHKNSFSKLSNSLATDKDDYYFFATNIIRRNKLPM